MTTIMVPPTCDAIPPVEGDPAGVRTFVDDLLASAVNVDDLDTFARDSARLDGWSGAAADAYGRYVRDTAADADAISAAVRRVARAGEDHAEALTELRRRRDLLDEDRTGYHAARSDLLADIRATTDADPAAVRELEDRAAALTSRLQTLVEDVDRLVRDVTAAEQAMLDALTSFSTLRQARAAVTGGTDLADAALARPGSPSSGGSPAEVAAWWDGLSEDEQLAVLAAHPEVVGNADGIPAVVRDRANRLLLETDLSALELREERGEILPAEDREALENGRAARAALAQGAQEVDPVTREPLVPLLHLYDPRAFGGDGRVAIAFGDPDTADHVSVMVPGLTSRGTAAETNAEAAFHIYESARYSDPHSSVASIMWIGYDAPSDWDSLTVAREDRAIAGGERLAQYVEGLRASREGSPAHLTVVGHSYGSTTTAHAASDHGLAADDIVLVGSPGAGGEVDHASDLGVGADHVWAGNNSRDPVAMLADNGWVGGGTLFGAGMGNDVGEDDFGANRFQAESTSRGEGLDPFADHTKYFDRNTESLFNIGQIVVGDYDEVLRAEHTYDPWWWDPVDPERHRTPTEIRRREEW
ncbi:alpha/beta hydrolase [Cellulomonas sp.]|uniref:alpha/beta hydrolase n=1 Tax=Cellulomonas sp. TaxID=40001 RepID=UPI0028116F4D|nr:alpha/beta hydrolase [Cellulomonas sp.]